MSPILLPFIRSIGTDLEREGASAKVALLEVDQDWSMASLQRCGFSEPLHCAASHWNVENL